MRLLIHFILSCLLAAALMAAWMLLANANQWRYFTGWGMAHGGFVIALPVCWLVAFFGLLLVPWIRNCWPWRDRS
jgi:hypothetical protein